MSELIAFLLPPAIGLAGMRLVRGLLGRGFDLHFGSGGRFAIGFAVGMLVFTQCLLAAALMGINLAALLGKAALIWGGTEFFLLAKSGAGKIRPFKIKREHLWFVLLLPLGCYFLVFARLSVVEGTMEFDGATHWLIKSKILYLNSGSGFRQLIHNPNLAYVHWDYPLLVPALYTLTYGALGSVNEFVTKVWPFWMMVSLCLAVLSFADTWQRPRPLPFLVVIILCFLPATLRFIHWEGGTIPMMFYAGLSTLLLVRALSDSDVSALAVSLLILVGGALTKFEGILYAGFWMLALLPLCGRRLDLRPALLSKASALAAICLLPYVAFRLHNPILHPESRWPTVLFHSPADALHNFPWFFAVALAKNFFSTEFSQWQELDASHFQWIGRWTGWRTFVNFQLGVLPCLTLLLVGLSLWQRRYRRIIIMLAFAVFGVLSVLALVVGCMPKLMGLPESLILTGDGLGRYYYPFLLAWFVGLASLWLREKPPWPADNAIAGTSAPPARRLTPGSFVTALVAIAATMLLVAQWIYFAHPEAFPDQGNEDQNVKFSLWYTYQRASQLGNITDPVEREERCIRLSSLARRIDGDIPRDARIFMDGVLGKDLQLHRSVYFFLRYYLFPRDMEISLDGKVKMEGTDFVGIPFQSEAELRSNGFDALIQFTTNDVVQFKTLRNL